MKDFSIQQTKRIEEIDYLRGFAILAVVAIHTSANFTKIQNVNLLLTINVIIDVFSHFAVPLFIFISGFVLSIKYKGQFSQKIFLQKRAKSILLPYIIFSTLYLLYRISFSAINNERIPKLKNHFFEPRF
ncbi:MAG: acyltransferase [Methanosarcina sp.]|jgi:fucose 4-O-acetylase-like acetyltransferase|nr:acyltransferase [Methanosarcina sp.]